jgi:molybdenum cofactor biosynthesis protein B
MSNVPASAAEHRASGPRRAGCFAITVSDTRTADTDASGRAIRELLERAGHDTVGYRLVRDEPAQVAAAVREALLEDRTQVVITTGGTGITSRDGTFEAIDGLFDKRLAGFGELFRMLSFQEIGAAAMLTRATAGTVGRKAVFVLPGAEHAVRLAMTRLIIPELGHVVQQLSR